jgi:hypothetical protein
MTLETFKIMNKLSPSCLHNPVHLQNSKYYFRYNNILDIPQVRTSRYGKKKTYQIYVFGADLKSNIAARVHNVFSLAEIKSSCQKPPSQLNCDFAGMIIGWSCTKLVKRLPIGNSRWLPLLDLNVKS